MSTIPTKPLGTNGPLVPRLGLGLMGLSIESGEPAPDEERFQFLDRAVELGETFWDTANVYGDSEDLIGKWFERTGKRDEIFLATKVGGIIEGKLGSPDVKFFLRSDAEHVKAACQRSLERLGTDCIDLFYLHRVDGKTPIEHTVQAMAELKAEGKIRHIGLSEVSAATLRRAHAVHPIAAVQVEYSPVTLEIEANGLMAACRELGVAIVAYSPLGKGLVTGVYRSTKDFGPGDRRAIYPRFSDENLPKNLVLADTIRGVAEAKGCTPGQLTLAWLWAQGDDIFPIPGTKKIKNLEENVGSVGVDITPAEVAKIRKLVDEAEVVGTRYPTALMGVLLADTPEL
ncbi:pyridoxine 4-dehydrogenase [Diplodia corticola]|uniref:Pyridoxine 4-dehydrogenase n=1 Tax=Diplodia corticola TaxID=236234 RepID=A0A1J9S0T4_9PEZI|nr:pyridoxine 4-dehydrogenase [Diplodia corticola]OJD33636.1 pyridoxine 4-dehydrogenase [Diplodia corticola]